MARKRASLATGLTAVKAAPEAEPMVTTSIHIPRSLLRELRLAAVDRADQAGGRPSVSALVVELLERHRAEISA